MDKIDYCDKIEGKLIDKTVYEQIKKDPTEYIKKTIKIKADKLLKQKKITLAKLNELTSIDELPKIRRQPKLHKTNIPMRILTCSKDTIKSPVSQFMFKIFKKLESTSKGV
ncbi:unnamed protein product, partial [Rotaria sp. Silwood2]